MKKLFSVLTALLLIFSFLIHHHAFAAGSFGPPQPLARESGGMHTAFGYWYSEDRYGNGSTFTLKQNRIYTEAGYGTRLWDIYGRMGLADLKILDAYQSRSSSTTASKNDFQDNWSLFGTLGGKIFYPVNEYFGIGSFAQASYTFSDFNDNISGISNVVPFTTNLKVVNPWDVAIGIGFQAKVLSDVRLYAGPYFYYSEVEIRGSTQISGISLTGGDTLRNKNRIGGYAGVDLPLYKTFRLNVEGQYSERFSGGCSISLIY